MGVAASENVFRAPKRYTKRWVTLGLDNYVVGVGVGHAAAGGKVTVKIQGAHSRASEIHGFVQSE